MIRTAFVVAVLLLLLALGRVAQAFPTGEQFDLDPVMADGAGGIAFTGAPRFAHHTCNVCHLDAPGEVGLRLEADHPELFTTGWKPGQLYHLRVVLLGDHAGAALKANGDHCGFSETPYRACDENGFSLELDDTVGRPVGRFVPFAGNACVTTGTAPSDADVRVLNDGSAVTHNGAHMAMTAWNLCWNAPAAGTGTLTAFLAAVDGNGGTGTIDFPTDVVGDDVVSGTVPIGELGASAPPPQVGGCAVTCDADPGALIAIALVVGLVAWRRPRRSWPAVAVLAIVAITGCTHVRPRQRETLAHRKMKFAPDPTEDELDLHMQESREGSSGGYGSSGGGCGCN